MHRNLAPLSTYTLIILGLLLRPTIACYMYNPFNPRCMAKTTEQNNDPDHLYALYFLYQLFEVMWLWLLGDIFKGKNVYCLEEKREDDNEPLPSMVIDRRY
jgi:hypothetical protein